MDHRRRDFLRWAGLGLAAAGYAPLRLFSASGKRRLPLSPLRLRSADDGYPFPYDERYFLCAERVYNLRSRRRAGDWTADLNLLLKEGETLDIEIAVSGTREGLSRPDRLLTFSGVQRRLDTLLVAEEGSRLHYQVRYRRGTQPWGSLSPKSVKIPHAALDSGGQVNVVLFADDHTFDDADARMTGLDRTWMQSGDYVNEFLRNLRKDDSWEPSGPLGKLKNGFTLAQALLAVLDHEDPDLVILLGDTTGIGSGYRWKDLGFPWQDLTDEDYDSIAQRLWLRMRKLYSALTPRIPVLISLGNHDGEEGWNSARRHAREWRKRYFPLPDDRTYPEGGSPDGNYFALTLGADRENRGGVEFVFLDVCSYSGNTEPVRVEDWTLGESQNAWLDTVLQDKERDWILACFHHVLGGWPAGPDESRQDVAYGRGPLFTGPDYQDHADPGRVEQVALTEKAKEAGVRAFLYGHDHIFHSRALGPGWNGREVIGLCCGTPKYVGEQQWWRGEHWRRHYGDGFDSNPDFYGPPGYVRLTVRSGSLQADYVQSARSGFSNIPPESRPGDVLSRVVLENPAPFIVLDPESLTFRGQEGRLGSESFPLRVKNGGARSMSYALEGSQPWITAAPSEGRSWGEWDDVQLVCDLKSLRAGEHQETLSIRSLEAGNSPLEVKLRFIIEQAPILPPARFRAEKKRSPAGYSASGDVLLTWGPNRDNVFISRYNLYVRSDGAEETGLGALLVSVPAGTHRYVFRPRRQERWIFSLTAVDDRHREGEPAVCTFP